MADETTTVENRSGQSKKTTRTRKTKKTRVKNRTTRAKKTCGKIADVLRSPEFAAGLGVVATILGGLSGRRGPK